MAERGKEGSESVGAGSKKALFWTPPMSVFMLRLLAKIVTKGVKTDKGFKDIHLNQVAKSLSEYIRGHVSSMQVHNHLRKWRARWVKISQLKDLNGALWKDENNMIVLEEQHYLGHTKDHPKDAEFLNVPLENYAFMETIFSTRQATGKFAMGSNEPLGVPIDVESSCKDGNEGIGGEVGGVGLEFGVEGLLATTPSPSSSTKKRKRSSFLGEVESTQFNNMSDAVREMADTIKYTVHGDRPVGLYKAIMDLKVFPLNHRLAVLGHLTENKGKCLNFMEMEEDVRVAFVERFIAKNPDLL